MKVSLAVVAYNEEKYLPSLLQDILEQTYPHEKTEVVFVDSMSEDATAKWMREFQEMNKEDYLGIQMIQNPGRIQSCGWNEAILHFTTDVLIRVDAHSHIPADFIEKNVENLKSGEMVSGGVRPARTEGDGAWQKTLLLAEESMFGSSVSSVRRKGERAYVKSFFHGAYRREVLEEVGGFREDLGRTEDNEFHYRIRKHGFRLCMSPDIISYQYIRPTLRRMCRQKAGNGYWIGLTLGVCPECLSFYHLIPGAFLFGILFTTILSMLHVPVPAVLMWSAYAFLAVVMAVLSIISEWKKPEGTFYFSYLLLPFLFLILHVSYGAGTWGGLVRMPFWRRKHRTGESAERIKEQMRNGRTTV